MRSIAVTSAPTLVNNILTENGFRGLYRGLGPTILGYLPTWAISFAIYDQNSLWQNSNWDAQSQGQSLAREHPWSLHSPRHDCRSNEHHLYKSIETRFMTQQKGEVRYRHTLDAALTIWRTEGVRAFYRGLEPSLLGILHVAVQFPLYEKLKMWAQAESDAPLTSQTILLCSAISKMTASIATYPPHEVIRTQLQTQRRPLADDLSSDGMIKQPLKRGIVYTTQKLIVKEGWTALYKGLSINLLRTVPNSAVTMLTYEMLMRHLSARTS